MFHVKQTLYSILNLNISQFAFLIFALFIPIQLRIVINPYDSFIAEYFSYHLAFFVYFSDILFIAVLASWAIFDKKLKIGPIFWLTLAFLLYLIFRSFHVEHTDNALYSMLKWAQMLMLVLFLNTHLSKTFLKYLIFILFLGAIFQSCLGIWQFHNQSEVGLNFLGEYVPSAETIGSATIVVNDQTILRSYGTFPHPNVLGGFLTIGILLGIYYVSRETQVKSNIFSIFGLIVICIGLFLSASRSAWIASLMGSVIYSAYLIRFGNKKWLIKAIILLFVSCGTIFFTYSDILFNRINNVSSAIDYRENFTKYFEIIKPNIFIGVGQGNYIPILAENVQKSWEIQPIHNIFLMLIAELGIMGLILFISLILISLGSTWNNLKKPQYFTLFSILAGFIVISFLDHYLITIQQGQLMFFTILGIISGFNNVSDP